MRILEVLYIYTVYGFMEISTDFSAKFVNAHQFPRARHLIRHINPQGITVEYWTCLTESVDWKFAITWPAVRTEPGVIVLVGFIALNGANQHSGNS
jgi:hypothetical protein